MGAVVASIFKYTQTQTQSFPLVIFKVICEKWKFNCGTDKAEKLNNFKMNTKFGSYSSFFLASLNIFVEEFLFLWKVMKFASLIRVPIRLDLLGVLAIRLFKN